MRFKPMHFGFSHRTILEPNRSEPLEFAPITAPVETHQASQNVNALSRSDRLDRSDVADNLELHAPRLPRLGAASHVASCPSRAETDERFRRGSGSEWGGRR